MERVRAQFSLRSMQGVALSDRGRERNDNQDSYGIVERENYRFYLVADGMGGARAGGIASDIAVSVMIKMLTNYGDLSCGLLESAIHAANANIRQVARARPDCQGMGTTICGIGFTVDKMFICNVGDSRLYRLRKNIFTRLTQDHTMAAELVRSGQLTEQQSIKSPVAHVLTRALGVEEHVEVDVHQFLELPEPGDRYLVCSDGLHGMISEEVIGKTLKQGIIKDAASKLVFEANQAGGFDNVTVVAIEVRLPNNAKTLSLANLEKNASEVNKAHSVPSQPSVAFELKGPDLDSSTLDTQLIATTSSLKRNQAAGKSSFFDAFRILMGLILFVLVLLISQFVETTQSIQTEVKPSKTLSQSLGASYDLQDLGEQR
jgi:PPM family protein phosphatase